MSARRTVVMLMEFFTDHVEGTEGTKILVSNIF